MYQKRHISTQLLNVKGKWQGIIKPIMNVTDFASRVDTCLPLLVWQCSTRQLPHFLKVVVSNFFAQITFTEDSLRDYLLLFEHF
jgi:hypothetical protein